MNNREAMMQVRAFARIDGLWLTLVWTASFAMLMAAPGSSLGGMLALATPFVVGARLVRFRERVLGGVISVLRGSAYAWYTVFYASLLFAVVQYVYFMFLDEGHFAQIIGESAKAITALYEAQGMATQEIKDSMALITTMTPMQYTFTFMVQNMVVGALLAAPIALVCRRTVKRRQK